MTITDFAPSTTLRQEQGTSHASCNNHPGLSGCHSHDSHPSASKQRKEVELPADEIVEFIMNWCSRNLAHGWVCMIDFDPNGKSSSCDLVLLRNDARDYRDFNQSDYAMKLNALEEVLSSRQGNIQVAIWLTETPFVEPPPR